MSIPVFDGHNDFLLRLMTDPAGRAAIWNGQAGGGHLDLPRMRQGHFAGGFFAIYMPALPDGNAPDLAAMNTLMATPPYALPLPPALALRDAQPMALAQAAHLLALEREAPEAFRICRSVAEIEDCIARGIIAAVMHMEGAEAIDPDLDALHLFHALGLRSLGPVWSRPTAFGHGVPFRYPSSPDTGPGLTDAGKRLVRACNSLRIMIDLSHLNAKGVDDIAAISDAPLVATHSNAHAICPSARNLTDRQLAMIRDSDGMVGLNFATAFLRPDGKRDPDFGWEVMARHLDHLIAHLGEDRVGFGSDFDGAEMPAPLGDVTGLPAFQDALRAHGYDDALLRKLCHENWLAVLRRTWGA